MCSLSLDLPLFVDSAYFVYHGRLVASGVPLYEATIYGYGPYGPMVSAAFELLFSWVPGIDPVQAQRLGGVVVYGSILVLIFQSAERVFVSRRIALCAAFAWLSLLFPWMASSISLEPKLLVAAASLFWLLAVSAQRWLVTGFWAAFAGLSWQPAVLLAPAGALAAIVLTRRVQPILRLCGGVFLGTLPAVLYLTLTDQWAPFWTNAVQRKAAEHLPEAFDGGLQWLARMPGSMAEDLPVFLAASAGAWIWFSRRSRDWLNDARFVGVVLLGLTWVTVNVIDYGGIRDGIPLLPVVSMFAGICIAVVYGMIREAGIGKFGMVTIVALTVIATFGDLGLTAIPVTRTTQASVFLKLNDYAGGAERIVSYSVTEHLAETGQPSSGVISVFTGQWALDSLERAYPGGLEQYKQDLQAQRPNVVLLRAPGAGHVSFRFIADELFPDYVRTHRIDQNFRLEYPKHGYRTFPLLRSLFGAADRPQRSLYVFMAPEWYSREREGELWKILGPVVDQPSR